MKDYTKYDFAAIVGAEVSVLLKSKVEYGGTLKIVGNKTIFLLMNDNPLTLEGRWVAIEDIVPGSLTAKIKVEDMSVKQLKRLTEEEKERFDEDVLVVLCMKQKTMFYDNGKFSLYDGRTFNNYIDCTDWGWKK